MCPCYWLFCTAVEGRRGQTGRQAVDQRPHDFVLVVWQLGRIYKSSDSSYPVSGPRWPQVLPSEEMSWACCSLLEFIITSLNEMKSFQLTLPPKTLGAFMARRERVHSLSNQPEQQAAGAHHRSWGQKDISVFQKSAFVTKEGCNSVHKHAVVGNAVEP